jgi:glycosyltransferase involved in cell wall biosynthesis
MTSDLIELERPESIAERPSIGLHLMVKNGASVVGRLLDCVGPHLTEVVVVLNDCSDDTYEVLAEGCERNGIKRLVATTVTSETHPDLYIRDIPETYAVGQSLVGEVMPGPHTGRPLLANWAAARNIGWCLGDAKWRLFLDADDVVDDPECLPGLCRLLAERDLDAASSRYHYDHTARGESRASAYRERLCRNIPQIHWVGQVHEILTGYDTRRVAHVDGSLVVRDRRDSAGAGIRVPGRNLKVLYQWARSIGWQIGPRSMLYLAAEARSSMPRLAQRLLRDYLEVSTWAEERAWARSMLGEMSEAEERYATASSHYEEALDEYPGVGNALRLCRSRFHEGRWADVLAAHDLAMRNKVYPQLLDGSETLEDATKLLVVGALRKLGRVAEAREMCREVAARFPRSAPIAEMMQKLEDRG